MKKIIIKNYGIITPLGNTQETINNLHLGKSAVKATNEYGLPVSLAYIDKAYPRTPKEIVAYYKQMGYGKYNSPQTLFIYAAAKGDINKIVNAPTVGRLRAAVEKHYDGDYSPVLGEQANEVARDLGLGDCRIIFVSNACASGAVAIDTAKICLESGEFNTAVIFGLEQITEFVVKGFHCLNAVSPTGAKPFDESRDGMSLGEGSGICVLSTGGTEGSDVCVLGCGASNDANHRTGPSRTGDGLALAIKRALKSANINAEDIDAVKCHATATIYNDAMETKALESVFGDRVPPIVAMKGAIGHLSGAGSMIETVIAAEFLKKGKIVASDAVINNILCLSAGFGGINTAVILGKI